MFNPDTEFIFPPRIIPMLGELRGPSWQSLVEQVHKLSEAQFQLPASLQDTEPRVAVARLAFTLLMVRLGGCLTCQVDSYRGMQGCTQCASQILHRYRGSDEELLRLYREAHQEVEQYLSRMSG